jgi:hypothetical protein
MAREFLMLVHESAYTVPVASPLVWTTATAFNTASAYYIRLDEGNAFAMRPRPQEVEIPYGGGLAIGAYRAADKIECRGNLRCKLTAGIAPFLLGWASTRVDAAQTLPWAQTTEPPGDLVSVAAYHAIMRDDGTFKRRAYLGCKVDSWALDMSSDSTVGTLNLGLSASVPQGNVFDASTDPTAVTFPAPADNNLPVDPYLFTHTSGGVVLNGTSRLNISQLTLTGTNTLARSFFNQRFIGKLRFTGRKTTAACRLLYVTTPDDRTTYEGSMPYGVTPVAAQITWNTGTHTLVCNMNGQNVIDPLDEELPLDDLYLQSSTYNNLYDPTAHGDFAFSFT